MTHDTGNLATETFDVLVVGGGIVGAGIARDAAMRGLLVRLVEQNDFASGTSSRSSRLLHGGLRYLGQGDIALVREASREKQTIGCIAPHLCQPLPFLFPAYRGGAWPLWKLLLGVKTYDLLCGGRNFGPSESLARDELLGRLPALATEGLRGGVRYFDALTNDARLVIDTLRAAAAQGAVLNNYTEFVGADRRGDTWRASLRDRRTGETCEASARTIVNAAGPWSDSLPHSGTHLRLTKGVHLVVARARLPVDAAVVLAAGERILFAIPWGERVILGTTDTDYDGDVAAPRCTSADRDYVLHVVNRYFPSAQLTPGDVRAVWTGLRPLVADADGKPSDISRRHEITEPQPGWFDVTGGKLTTYRLMADETLARLTPRIGRTLRACRTDIEPLLPPSSSATVSGILPSKPGGELIAHYCQREWARHLDDVMLRRAGWHYYCDDRDAIARQTAAWMATALDWSPARQAEELANYEQLVAREHEFPSESSP
ncbi:MAG: glycerol-3-phosphate dehydrogenase/oxidase [Planctomycetales bacterium]|nr:glycerol-3-phosphate dehydrogenase/oxidase [Planctomycetales bacterium]